MVTGCETGQTTRIFEEQGLENLDAYLGGFTTGPFESVGLTGLDSGWHVGEGQGASGLSHGVDGEQRNADDGLEHIHGEEK